MDTVTVLARQGLVEGYVTGPMGIDMAALLRRVEYGYRLPYEPSAVKVSGFGSGAVVTIIGERAVCSGDVRVGWQGHDGLISLLRDIFPSAVIEVELA